MPRFEGISQIAGVVQLGDSSLKITASSSPFSITSTDLIGNISTYTEVNSGAPTSGTVGVWVFTANDDDISAITLRIGSNSSNYTEIAGVKTYTDAFDLQEDWNYFVFRLKNGTETGTPDWTAASYVKIEFTSSGTPTVYADYLTLGTGDKIGLNGLGSRTTAYTEEIQNY